MGAFDDLIPQKKGGFADLIPPPQAAPTQQPAPQPLQFDITNIPEEFKTPRVLDIMKSIEAEEGLIPAIREGDRAKADLQSSIDKRKNTLSRLIEIKQTHPELAKQAEETSDLDAFLATAGRGLTRVARGATELAGLDVIDPETDLEQRSFEALKLQNPKASTAGELTGETAPFLLAGGPLAGLARTGTQKTLGGILLGQAEAGSIAKGRGGDSKQVALATILGGLTGGGASLATSRFGGGRVARRERVTAARELLREPTDREVRDIVAEAVPTPQQLRQASSSIYDSVRDLGVELSPRSYRDFLNRTRRGALDIGLDVPPAGRSLTPQSQTVLDRLEALGDGRAVTVTDLERARRTAQNAASVATGARNSGDANINNLIVDNIDEYLNRIDASDFTGNTANIGGELTAARRLWGRARKAELLDEAVERAQGQASGIENGIRIQFRQILNNRKHRRFFSDAEIGAMNDVVRGTVSANTFKRIGKLGFGSGQQTNVLSGLVSAGVGSTSLSAMFGPVGAGIGLVILPTAGTISKRLAENLTRRSAAMANQIVRAGADADDIARAYLRGTSASQRSADDLAVLLMRPDVNLAAARAQAPIVAEALTRAEQMRQTLAASSTAVAIPAVSENTGE